MTPPVTSTSSRVASLRIWWQVREQGTKCYFHNLWFIILISPDGNVGLTFGHIIASQFDALRSGDRFFFTHENGAEHFNPSQGLYTYDICRIFVLFLSPSPLGIYADMGHVCINSHVCIWDKSTRGPEMVGKYS